jgi:hypothetical protein
MRKRYLIIFIIFWNSDSFCQQSFSANFLDDIKSPYFKSKKAVIASLRSDNPKITAQAEDDSVKARRKNLKLNLPVFSLEGSGNLNWEKPDDYNGSGKISFLVRPVQFGNNAISIYASYNKNASNNDSVLFQKLIFPEIGNSSFTGALQFDKYWRMDKYTGHALSPFFEFSHKNISSSIIDDSASDRELRNFTSLNYVLGVKYVFGFWNIDKNDSSKNLDFSFFAIPYLSFSNIPNEDTSDYRFLLARNAKLLDPTDRFKLTDNISTAGFKIGFQIKRLQIYADFRSVLNKGEKVPIRELKGFHANIGFVVNAEVLQFRRETDASLTKSKKGKSNSNYIIEGIE